MDRIRFIEYRGVRILHVSYAGIEHENELRAVAIQAGRAIREQPLGSALVLIDLAGVPFTLEHVAMARREMAENRVHVRARAVCGMPPIAQLSFAALARLSGRPLRHFDDPVKAKEWLVEIAR